MIEDIAALWQERMAVAIERGVPEERIVLDPGFDLGKPPEDSVEILEAARRAGGASAARCCWPSRARTSSASITGRRPAERDAGTLGAIEPALGLGVDCILRVHDVAGARDFLAVREALREPGATVTELAPELRTGGGG